MKIHKLGYILLGVGIFIVVFALISDSIGLGRKGVQAAQLLLIQFGGLLFVTSIGLLNFSDIEINIHDLVSRTVNRVLNIPASNWVILGFLIAYLLLFIFPIFFNPDRRIVYFARYIPEITPIGRDLRFNTSSIQNWLSGNGLYNFENHYYPPLYAVIFSPFLLLEYPVTYFLMTGITLLIQVNLSCLTERPAA